MFSLTVAYVNQAEREREIERGLQRRQILSPPESAVSSVEPAAQTARANPGLHPTPIRARAAGR